MVKVHTREFVTSWIDSHREVLQDSGIVAVLRFADYGGESKAGVGLEIDRFAASIAVWGNGMLEGIVYDKFNAREVSEIDCEASTLPGLSKFADRVLAILLRQVAAESMHDVNGVSGNIVAGLAGYSSALSGHWDDCDSIIVSDLENASIASLFDDIEAWSQGRDARLRVTRNDGRRETPRISSISIDADRFAARMSLIGNGRFEGVVLDKSRDVEAVVVSLIVVSMEEARPHAQGVLEALFRLIDERN
jgi:hypothetical protein